MGPSVTDRIPLVGAEGYEALSNQVEHIARTQVGLPTWRITHLLQRYGSLLDEVLEVAESDESLLEPLPGAEEYLKIEIVYAASHEGALHLDDLLSRRTRISIEAHDRGDACAEPRAALVAPVLGWDERRVEDEVAAYRARVAAERESAGGAGRPGRQRRAAGRTRHPGPIGRTGAGLTS